MKKLAYVIGTCTGVLISLTSLSEAAIIVLNNMNAVTRQPVTAVVTNANGTSYQQTYYYDPSLNGVDVNLTNPGESIYFPEYDKRYLWDNGYWVNEQSYYWDKDRYSYVNHPHWHDHWHSYWNNHRGNDFHHNNDDLNHHSRERIRDHHHHHHSYHSHHSNDHKDHHH